MMKGIFFIEGCKEVSQRLEISLPECVKEA
jgi:hypothetical protein